MAQKKIALIGCGGMGTHHLLAYKDIPEVDIVAICDIVPGRAEDRVEKHAPNAKAYSDYREVLEIPGLDAVDICTPNYLHSIIAVEALNKGLHVFCEKPDAVNVEEALKMKAAAEANDRVLMVMRNNRYSPEAQFLKKFIEDGKMGEIYAGRCGWQRRRGIPGKGGWFTTKAQSGGGPLIDLGVHMIDLAIWLMGNPTPVAVSGSTYCKFADSDMSDSVNSNFGDKMADGTFDVEDLAMGFIRFDNGACLQIEFSWASNVEKEKKFVELRGTKAGASWPDLKIFTEEYGSTVDVIPAVRPKEFDGHGRNLAHFVEVLQGKAEPAFVPQQGVNMIRILRAMYESAEKGCEVRL